MSLDFRGISLSYKTAPIEVREAVAVSDEENKNILFKLREVFGIMEAILISTCNRTEIYYSSSIDCDEQIATLLLHEKGLMNVSNYIHYFKKFSNSVEASKHLFEVSLGLHSQVVGDLQIINQVKKAYQVTADLGMAGPYLHRLLHTIFFANKRVSQETNFRDGAATVSYAAVELTETLVNDNTSSPILLIGIGEMGLDVAKTLFDKGYTNVTLINRTFEKAQKVARECDFKVLEIEKLKEAVYHNEVVISSVSAPNPVISVNMFEGYTPLKHKYFIDLSVPRSVEAEVEQVNGMLVYNLDQLQNKANEALKRRKESIPMVEKIVDESLLEFEDWTKEMTVSPTIQKLKNALEQIRQEELARHVKQLSNVELEKVELITKNIMQKIIKLPVLQLKAACKRGEAETLIDVLNDLFNLEKEKVS
ncbi:MAG: glutamyl-tRNA reductase [Cytophagales bacterium]